MDEAPAVSAPALGYSILANLGDEKQITVQCYADSEEPLGNIHGKIDKAMAVIERQQARYRVKDLRKEVDKLGGTLRNLHEDLLKAEDAFVARKEAINTNILEARQRIDQLHAEAVGRGRAKPVGAEAAQVNALKRDIEQLSEARNKLEGERKQALGNSAVSIGRYEEEIDKASKQIAECEALITGG